MGAPLQPQPGHEPPGHWIGRPRIRGSRLRTWLQTSTPDPSGSWTSRMRSVGLLSNRLLLGGIAFELVFAAAAVTLPAPASAGAATGTRPYRGVRTRPTDAGGHRGPAGLEPRDRDPEGRARDVVEPDVVEEVDGDGIATVLTASSPSTTARSRRPRS